MFYLQLFRSRALPFVWWASPELFILLTVFIASVSVTTEIQTVSPGSCQYMDSVWELKEQIRHQTGHLQQERSFFCDAYREAMSYLLFVEETLLGFLSVQEDGYILFLGVAPTHHQSGYGKTLVEHATEQFQSLECHTRVSNHPAVEFYQNLEFEVSHTVTGYYRDGTDAYYLIRNCADEKIWSQWRTD